MYKHTRQEAADMLGISTRSIDRYVKAGKLRAKKDGKVVYINSSDLDNLNSSGSINQEIIVEKPITNTNFERKPIYTESKEIEFHGTFKNALDEVYEDLRNEIKEKDTIIRELSIRVGRAEEVAKNSVSLIDFKKSQFLLEESKTNLNQALVDLQSEKETITTELKYQKTNNLILLISLIVLFAIAGTIFIIKI
ncbi:MAG: helix-turn-helix domain-containing protein [Candidatus Gracilibacteria bacterium]|nr:helix-turn-helix domain-containing protein [Candidatus Gracilibacteria bacterium]